MVIPVKTHITPFSNFFFLSRFIPSIKVLISQLKQPRKRKPFLCLEIVMHGDLFSFKPNHAIYIVGYILRNLFSFNFPPVSLKLQSVFVFCHNTVTLLVVGGGFLHCIIHWNLSYLWELHSWIKSVNYKCLIHCYTKSLWEF